MMWPFTPKVREAKDLTLEQITDLISAYAKCYVDKSIRDNFFCAIQSRYAELSSLTTPVKAVNFAVEIAKQEEMKKKMNDGYCYDFVTQPFSMDIAKRFMLESFRGKPCEIYMSPDLYLDFLNYIHIEVGSVAGPSVRCDQCYGRRDRYVIMDNRVIDTDLLTGRKMVVVGQDR